MKHPALLFVSALAMPSAALAATAGAVLHDFTGSTDGAIPTGLMLRSAAGTLYGTTEMGGQYADGTAYMLSPPSAGSTRWSFTLLHPFGGASTDGIYPDAGLAADGSGNLFGTTIYGPPQGANSGYGTVFELKPPSAGQSNWKEAIVHEFKSLPTDCSIPTSGVIIGPGGVLYGTGTNGGPTSGVYGCVFELTPPATGQTRWTETILHFFQGQSANDGSFPEGGLVSDSAGNLYGTTQVGGVYDRGTVYELSPPPAGQTAWGYAVLYNFAYGFIPNDGASPSNTLALDAAGALYGTTADGGSGTANAGIVFKLTPPAARQSAWTESVLTSFNRKDGNGVGTPLLDKNGAIYGVANGGGTSNDGLVYKLTPPGPGQTSWPETILYNFQGGIDGTAPLAGLITDPTGNLYGNATYGGVACTQSKSGCGTIFEGFH